MTRRGALVAAALVAVVNAFVLARVALNRRATDGTLTLTEREAPVAWVSPRDESSGVALRIATQHWVPWSDPGAERLDPLGWLDGPKLAELGFDVALPEDPEEAQRFVSKQRSRAAWAVVEHAGPACESYRRRLAATYGLADPDAASTRVEGPVLGYDSRAYAARELRFGSRLFVVDAGRDPGALRARYPDRHVHLIVPAKVHAYAHASAARPEDRVHGDLSLLTGEVNVPRPLQAVLPPADVGPSVYRSHLDDAHAPRYEVVLRSGARHEPWIEAIRPLSP